MVGSGYPQPGSLSGNVRWLREELYAPTLTLTKRSSPVRRGSLHPMTGRRLAVTDAGIPQSGGREMKARVPVIV
jgi:hypothetical protein